jgi:hypothetical protein
MDAETAKIRLKLGAIEVEYEGKADFLQDGLLNVMKEIVGFYGEHKATIPVEPLASATAAKPAAGAVDLSTSTIASRP